MKWLMCVLCLLCLTGCAQIEQTVRDIDWNKTVNDTIDSGKRIAGRIDWQQHFDAVGDLTKDVLDAVKPELQK